MQVMLTSALHGQYEKFAKSKSKLSIDLGYLSLLGSA